MEKETRVMECGAMAEVTARKEEYEEEAEEAVGQVQEVMVVVE